MNLKTSTLLPRLPRPVVMMLATLFVAAAASLAQTAYAQPMGDMKGGPGGMRGGHGGMRGEGMGMGGAHMGRALDLVKATPEQRTQIKTIMDAAQADLKAQHEAGRSLQQQMQDAFAQPAVDARAVESLRAQMSAQRDTASKRMTQAMLDASRVLTAEQRKTLADMMAKRQSMMQRHASERATLDKATK